MQNLRVLAEQEFPHLANSRWQVTSPPDNSYNCIAWAAGENHRRWDVDPQGFWYWPPAATRGIEFNCLVEAYLSLGYERCSSPAIEEGYEKVALFSKNGNWTHAARQLSNGNWTSKLGNFIDMEHELGGLDGNNYGQIELFMKRRLDR